MKKIVKNCDIRIRFLSFSILTPVISDSIVIYIYSALSRGVFSALICSFCF